MDRAMIAKGSDNVTSAFDVIRSCLASLLVSLVLAWALDIPRLMLGTAFLTQEFTLSVAGLSLALAFLPKPGARARRIDGVIALAGLMALLVCLYSASRYRVLSEEMFYFPVESLIIGSLLVPLVLVALYRRVGLMLVGVVLFFILYGLIGDIAPAPFTSRPWSLADLLPHLVLDTTSMVGVPLTIGCTVVIPFIVFGAALFITGGGQFFADIAVSMMGGYRGGAAKIAVISSALFGTISGSAVSNVASTGVISIPMMQKAGLKPRIAAATEAVASTGGQFMPPVMGAAAFLMSELSRIPYTLVALAAILPAFFFFFAVFMQSDSDAIKFNVTAVPKSQRLPLAVVLQKGWHFIIPFGVLVVLMFSFNQPPQLAAIIAAATTLLLGAVRDYGTGLIRLQQLWTLTQRAGNASFEIVIIVAAAGFVIGILNATGLVFTLTLVIVELAGNQLLWLLILAALISIVLGMGMPTVAVYVLLAALVVPSLIEAGISTLPAHMFVLYFGMMSMITPPIAIASFAAASLAEEPPLRVAFVSMRYAWAAYLIPFIFVYRSDFLIGSEGQSFLSTSELVVATTIMILTLNAAISGCLNKAISWGARILLAASGITVFLGIIWFDQALVASGAAFLVYVALMFWQRLRHVAE